MNTQPVPPAEDIPPIEGANKVTLILLLICLGGFAIISIVDLLGSLLGWK